MIIWVFISALVLVLIIFAIRIILVMLKTEKESKPDEKPQKIEDKTYTPVNAPINVGSATNSIVTDMSTDAKNLDNVKAEYDFDMPDEPMYIDTTAGVCTACGLIEIAKLTNDKKYLEAAIKTLKNIEEKYCDYSDEEDAILMMGTERYPHFEQDFEGVHIPIIYGDFFLAEAILKLKGSDFLIW